MMCLKNPYRLPNIDRIIDESLGYKTLSFINTYFGYTQIKIDSLDASKMMYMSNNHNYY